MNNNNSLSEQLGGLLRSKGLLMGTAESCTGGRIANMGCDCSVATSGVAGPGGGSPEKPVGTVWIAAALKEQVVSHCYHFGTVRAENIQSAADTALTMLLELLQKSDG